MDQIELTVAWDGSSGWRFAPSHGGGLTTYAGGSAARQLVDDAPSPSSGSDYVIEARLARRRLAERKRTQRARFTVIK